MTKAFHDGFMPLSQSPIWDLQKQYYRESSIHAWESGAVPSYITTTPVIARSYARIMGGFFDDYSRLSVTGKGEQRRRYIFELGAGSGCFAYRFLKYFANERAKLPAGGVDIVYVMTDISDATIDFWRQHPLLIRYVEAGLLDFAKLDCLDDKPVRLLISDRKITPGSLKTPMAVIGNYVIDSLPHDIFTLEDGKLKARLVRAEIPDNSGTIAEMVRKTGFDYREEDCPPSPYEVRDYNRILNHCRAIGGSLHFSLPTGGFRMMERMAALSTGPCFFLCGDFGASHIAALRDLPPRRVARNGAYSVHVNFHAMAEYATARRGRAFLSDSPKSSLEIAGFLYRPGRRRPRRLVERFDLYVNEFGPEEFFLLKKSLEKQLAVLPLSRILGLLQLSGWDTKMFNLAAPGLLRDLPKASQAERESLLKMLRAVDDMHFRCDSLSDPVFAILKILLMLNEREAAYEILKRNEPLARENAEMRLKFAEVYRLFEAEEEALRIITELIAENPHFDAAKELADALGKDATIAKA